MPIVDRAEFSPQPEHEGFSGSVQLNGRSASVTIRSLTGNVERAWANAERVLTCLRDQMSCVEDAVRGLVSRLGTPSEDTPRGRREIERLLGQLSESDMTCRIYDDTASVYFDAPRMTDHVIEVQFTGGKLAWSRSQDEGLRFRRGSAPGRPLSAESLFVSRHRVPRVNDGKRMIHRLGAPTAKQVAARAEEVEAQIEDPANRDDPNWLRRKAAVLRQVATKKEKALAEKLAQRRERRHT
jgi:hypothetical protein